MKRKNIIAIICIIVVVIIIVISIEKQCFYNRYDYCEEKGYNDQEYENGVGNDYDFYCLKNGNDIQKKLNNKTIECSDQQKEANKQAILDYTDYSNLCCIKKEQCRDELRNVKLNLTKYTDRYNCLKYNGTEVC